MVFPLRGERQLIDMSSISASRVYPLRGERQEHARIDTKGRLSPVRGATTTADGLQRAFPMYFPHMGNDNVSNVNVRNNDVVFPPERGTTTAVLGAGHANSDIPPYVGSDNQISVNSGNCYPLRGE